MRGIAATVVCVLVGCVREKALLIEVQIDDHTKRVELMLVRQPCPDCGTGMGLPNATTKTPGTVMYTDGDQRFYHDAIDGSNAVPFKIEPGDDDHLLSIIAVGFDDQDQPRSLLEIPGRDPGIVVSKHLGERWEVVLLPQAIGGPNNIQPTLPPGQDSYYLWRPSSDTSELHASCMKVKRAADSSVEFIVPPIDSDCDEITDSECDRTWYHHAVAPDLTKLCLGDGRFGACRIGNPSSCVDGDGSACATGSTCVPDGACSTCTKLDATCVDSLFLMSAFTLPRLECSIAMDTSGGVAPYPACGTVATVDGTAFPGCSHLGFAPVGALSYPLQTFGMISFGTGISMGTLKLTNPTSSCMFDIDVTATTSDLQTVISHPAVFTLTGAQGDTMVIPVVVNLHSVAVCTNNMPTCAFAPASMNQNIWSCGK